MSVQSQRQIQILHVDDEPDLVDLTKTFLKRENDRFTIETATSADEGLERIDDQPPDCVVSDYNMPGMDGIEFLQAVRAEYPDLPFILFTGKGSEEVASDAISAGATDYLQKQSGTDQYRLLANRVQNAVDQYWSEQRLRETRKEYTAVFENAQNALILVTVEDDGFCYQQCNPRAVELIGREKTEIVGHTPSEALGPENGPKVVGAYRTCIERGTSVEYTVTLELPVGRAIRECEVTPVVTNGETEQLVVEFRDITQQRERQQELEKYGTVTDTLTDAVYVVDEEGQFTYINEEFVELVGYDRETILGNTPSLIKDGKSVEEAEHQLGRLLSSDGPDIVSFEVTIQPRDGDPIVCEDHMGVLPYDGDQFDGSVGTLRDITERIQREQESQRTRDLLGNMEELADAGAWEYDPDIETLVTTSGFCRIYGLDPDTGLTLTEAFEFFHPDDRDRLRDRFDTCLETGKPYEVDVRVVTANGAQKWLTARGERITTDGNGSVVRGYIQDITEQRSREQNLKRYRTVLNELPNPVVVYDEDGQYKILNDAAAEIRDTPRKELTGTKSRYLEQIREENPAEYDALFEGKRDSLRVELTAEFSGPGTRTFECWFSRITEAADPNEVVMITRDVTDRNERERQLNRERERYATLFEALPNPVLHAKAEDGEPIVETVNSAFEDTFGYDTETIRDEPLHEYVLPDDQDDATDRLNRRILSDGEVQTEVQRETVDGVRTFQLNVRTSDTNGGKIDGYAVYTDVTKQKQLERALKAEHDLVTGIVETVPVGLSVVDPDGSISFVNERLESISGRSLEELEDMSHDDPRHDLVDEHGEPLESGDTPFNQVASRETAIHNQVVGIRRPSGERVWLSVSGAPQYENGELERAVFAFEDITEQRELEAELSEVLGRVSDAFYALNDEFRFTHVNRRAKELLQASEDELLGETVWDMCPMAAETDKISDAFHAALDTQDPQRLELYYEPLEFWLETSVYPSESGISVYLQDVTEQKEYERELEAQNKRLEEFTSLVSHDLRSPLTVADGRLELAQETCESDHLDQAADAIDRSQALIQDLLTLAREGDDVSEVEPVELADVAKSGWETVESQSATLETRATQTIQADQSRLKQLLENFYRNAIEHGGDDVTVSIGKMDGGFYVADTGPGIPEDDRKEVFEAGYSTNEDGTGFGLRIVKQVANAHEWEVAVTESEQGGARFEVTGVEFADR